MNDTNLHNSLTGLKEKENKLLANIKTKLPELEKLLEGISSHWGYEDSIYRFYHHSFKVDGLQHVTMRIVDALKNLAPEGPPLCMEFEEIIKESAGGKKFEPEHNKNWAYHTRPIVETFFHAKYFLEMIVKYGKEMDEPPEMLPSGWAAVLCPYNLR